MPLLRTARAREADGTMPTEAGDPTLPAPAFGVERHSGPGRSCAAASRGSAARALPARPTDQGRGQPVERRHGIEGPAAQADLAGRFHLAAAASLRADRGHEHDRILPLPDLDTVSFVSATGSSLGALSAAMSSTQGSLEGFSTPSPAGLTCRDLGRLVWAWASRGTEIRT